MPGGGAAMLHLSEMVPEFAATLTDPEEAMGAVIVQKALLAPARLIASNAGVEGDVVIEKLLGQPFEIGYNAMADKVENLIESVRDDGWIVCVSIPTVQGVLDPAKVTRSGLQNACSIAGIMLTTQAVMVEAPKDKAAGKGGRSPMNNPGFSPSGMPAGLSI